MIFSLFFTEERKCLQWGSDSSGTGNVRGHSCQTGVLDIWGGWWRVNLCSGDTLTGWGSSAWRKDSKEILEPFQGAPRELEENVLMLWLESLVLMSAAMKICRFYSHPPPVPALRGGILVLFTEGWLCPLASERSRSHPGTRTASRSLFAGWERFQKDRPGWKLSIAVSPSVLLESCSDWWEFLIAITDEQQQPTNHSTRGGSSWAALCSLASKSRNQARMSKGLLDVLASAQQLRELSKLLSAWINPHSGNWNSADTEPGLATWKAHYGRDLGDYA